jgi:hypothetical protein
MNVCIGSCRPRTSLLDIRVSRGRYRNTGLRLARGGDEILYNEVRGRGQPDASLLPFPPPSCRSRDVDHMLQSMRGTTASIAFDRLRRRRQEIE